MGMGIGMGKGCGMAMENSGSESGERAVGGSLGFGRSVKRSEFGQMI
jgi:hypothetical protein